MLELPIATKVVPLVVAGMIALTPVNPESTIKILEAFKQKVVTVIKKEGYTTVVDDKGQQVKLPYHEKVVIERPDPNGSNKQGIISKSINGTIEICKSVYWWVKK